MGLLKFVGVLGLLVAVLGSAGGLELGRREAMALVSVVSRSLSVEESALSSSSERKAAKFRALDSKTGGGDVAGAVPETLDTGDEPIRKN